MYYSKLFSLYDLHLKLMVRSVKSAPGSLIISDDDLALGKVKHWVAIGAHGVVIKLAEHLPADTVATPRDTYGRPWVILLRTRKAIVLNDKILLGIRIALDRKRSAG